MNIEAGPTTYRSSHWKGVDVTRGRKSAVIGQWCRHRDGIAPEADGLKDRHKSHRDAVGRVDQMIPAYGRFSHHLVKELAKTTWQAVVELLTDR